MADLNELLEQLKALASGPALQSVEHLRDLSRVIEELNGQELNVANKEHLETITKRANELENGLVGLSSAQKGVAAGSKNMADSIMASLPSFAGGAISIGAITAAVTTADKALNKLTLGTIPKALKMAGAKLTADEMKSATLTMLGTYDSLIIPLQQKQEDAFATLFGGIRDTAGVLDDETLGGRFVKSAEQAQIKADAMGRAVDNTTNSFRFLKPGLDGATEAMEIMGKIGGQLTDTMFSMGEDISKVSLQNLMRFRNALNVSDEDMAKFGKLAAATGTTASTQFMRVEQAATAMSKATGINAKVLATDLVKMRADFKTFGSFSADELAKVAARAKSLGVEITKLTGLADKFDDFDTAAESMATLAQTMGINIDAFDMFQEEDPTKQLIMIRQAFQAAGQDITQMNRKQRKMIASSLGMDLAEVFPALSPQAVRGEEIRDKIDAVPETAVKGLSNAIDKFNLSVPAQAQEYFEGLTGLMTTHRATTKELQKATAQNALLDRETREQMSLATKGIVGMMDAANLAFSGMPNLSKTFQGKLLGVTEKTIETINKDRKAALGGIFKTVKDATNSIGKLTAAGMNVLVAGNDTEAQAAARKQFRSVAGTVGADVSGAAMTAQRTVQAQTRIATRTGVNAAGLTSDIGREIHTHITVELDGDVVGRSVMKQNFNGQTVADNIGNATNPVVNQSVNPGG